MDENMGDESGTMARTVDLRQMLTPKEADAMAQAQAVLTDRFTVFLYNHETQQIERVRTPVFKLDADRRKIEDLENPGCYIERNAHDVGLAFWASYGTDEYDMLFVARGAVVVATAQTIGVALTAARNSRAAMNGAIAA